MKFASITSTLTTLPKAVAVLGIHPSSNGLNFPSSITFGYQGKDFMGQFGDMALNIGKVWKPIEFKVVHEDVESSVVEDFAVRKGNHDGLASWHKSDGLERPISVSFSSDGDAMYVIDLALCALAMKGRSTGKEQE